MKKKSVNFTPIPKKMKLLINGRQSTGCIFNALQSIEKKESFSLPEKSVCDNCPASRDGKSRVKTLKRALELPKWQVYDDTKQGFEHF